MKKQYNEKKITACVILKQILEVLVFWVIILIIPILIDAAYRNTKIAPECMRKFFLPKIRCFGQSIGITGKRLRDFISGSNGLIMTIVGTIISTQKGIVEKTETKIFGISKRNLQFENILLSTKLSTKLKDCIRRANYLSPLVMIILILTENSITGLCILLCVYLHMLLQFYEYISSYNLTLQMRAVVEYLINLDMHEYSNALDALSRYFSNTNEWTLAVSMWNKILDVLMRKLDFTSQCTDVLSPYFITRKYYEKVFLQNQNETERQFFKQLEWCESSKDTKITNMVLKGTIDAVIPELSIEKLDIFLCQFIDFSSRCISLAENKMCDLTEAQIQKECLWISILLSARYRKEGEIKSWDKIKAIMDKVSSASDKIMKEFLGDEYWNLDGMSKKEKQRYKTEIDDLINEYENKDSNLQCLLNFGLLNKYSNISDKA